MTDSTMTIAAPRPRCARCGTPGGALCTGCAAHEPKTIGEVIAQKMPPMPEASLTADEVTETVCPVLDIDREELVRRSRIAGWRLWTWTDELAEPGWEQRFADALDAGKQRLAEQKRQTIAFRVGHALTDGPFALGSLSMTELLERIDAKLRPLAEQLSPEHGGRLICGPTGIGKTTALVAATRRLIADNVEHPDPNRPLAGVDLRWVRAADLPIARLGHGLGHGEAELVERARNCQILCLDDLGWESRRAGADDVIGEVIAYRYDTGRVTWVTTGLKPEQVVEKYGEAFTRKICEAGARAGKVLDLWPKESRQ
ncbi:MAG: hypothetical protein HS104_09720 [Polyangiaceae bacterium]|nr:hypothetical protein [Polyangiaceae bacterium]MCL4754362.1 hypothetical protein [Myxococcales bacterium]